MSPLVDLDQRKRLSGDSTDSDSDSDSDSRIHPI